MSFLRARPLSPLLGIVLMFLLSTAHAGNDFKVAVSIKPIHSIVAGLMKDLDAPELLISGKETPYSFKPSDKQLEGLKSLNLLIWVGPELEASLEQPIASLPAEVRVVELLSNSWLKILPSRSEENKRDPYFWLDDRNTIILLDELTALLQELDPARTHIYKRNRREMMERLSYIDRVYEYGYRGLKAGLGVQYFDTLQYFEQAYALAVIDRVVESPRHSVDAAAMLKVRQRIVTGDAKCLLTEAGLPMPNLGLLIDGPTKVNQGELDSLGVNLEPGPELYFQLMEHNTDAIKRCLGADMTKADEAKKQAHAANVPVVDGIGKGPFLLTDHLGGLVSPDTMHGKFQMLYFGYTSCPDICPTALAVQSKALRMLGDKADLVQPYFITVDPKRDTIKVMRDYVNYFDKRLIGVTGKKEMIDRMALQYKVKYEIVDGETGDPDLYLVDHSASLFLISPEGRFMKKFLDGITPQKLHDELLKVLPN